MERWLFTPPAKLHFDELLESVAAETPAPGGGSSAACAGALAAALVQMAASFALGRGENAERQERVRWIKTRAESLREHLLALAEQELHAYAPVLEALRLPSEDPQRSRRVLGARSEAAWSPLAIARAAAELAELAAEMAATANRHLIGDAVTGALLAEAATRAAVRLVEINLQGVPGDTRLRETAELVSRAAAAGEQARLTGSV